MTQEERQLLIKDLCIRLPYGVICCVTHKKNGELVKEDMKLSGIFEDGNFYFLNKTGSTYSDDYIPYLRPRSSMTKEEELEYIDLREDVAAKVKPWKCFRFINWLSKHHFDYNDLISRNLAIEAPKGMYDN